MDLESRNVKGDTMLSAMVPGTGISTGTDTICEHSVVGVGDIVKTEILLDLTGLNERKVNNGNIMDFYL